jgi:nicotinate-nucleotide adenylyltransferase
MLRLLIEGDPRSCMEVSELDAPRADGKPNYTYDTLLGLREQLLPDDKLFVLLGADSFLSMHQWHRAAELLLLADWIVAARPGSNLQQLDQALPPGIDPSPNAAQRDGCIIQQLTASDGRSRTLFLLPDLREDVSATEIRAALAELTPPLARGQRDTSRQVLTPSVIAYIHEHGLYR